MRSERQHHGSGKSWKAEKVAEAGEETDLNVDASPFTHVSIETDAVS